MPTGFTSLSFLCYQIEFHNKISVPHARHTARIFSKGEPVTPALLYNVVSGWIVYFPIPQVARGGLEFQVA